MSVRAALSFFTTIPMPKAQQHESPPSLDGIMAHAATAGLVVGVGVGLVLLAGTVFFNVTMGAVLASLAWAVLTGGLHLDGLADCADGLVVEAPPAKRLTIMKDPTVGTFALIAVFFVLAIKVAALWHMAQCYVMAENMGIQGSGAFFSLVLLAFIAALARALIFVACRAPNARAQEQHQGLGQAVTQGISPRTERNTAFLMLALLAITMFLGVKLMGLAWYSLPLACGGAVAMTFALVRWAKKRIGGVTGDVYGCLIELAECTMLVLMS